MRATKKSQEKLNPRVASLLIVGSKSGLSLLYYCINQNLFLATFIVNFLRIFRHRASFLCLPPSRHLLDTVLARAAAHSIYQDQQQGTRGRDPTTISYLLCFSSFHRV
jgi:hypothetical protein